MATDDKIINEKLRYSINKKQKKYQEYYQVKLINMNILQVNKYYLLIKVKSRTIEQTTFEYSPLEKAGEKQIKAIEDKGRN